MPREILLNAFDMNTVGHIQQGLWRHPRDQSHRHAELKYWTSLAQTLERGLFDGLFLADVLGIYDVYGGGPETALKNAVQIPLGDPMMVIPAMAGVTEHLGFGVTCTTTYEPPFMFARRMSTLDGLTNGRMGWNIVTGYLDSAARAVGLPVQVPHDERYDWADDYLDTVYRLWEGSWEDGAVLADRASGIYTDPTKVHRVQGAGRYKMDAAHLCAPTPQRTPVLYQAGASARGQRFAGEHAECVFVATPSKTVLKKTVAAIRQSVAAAGRDPRGVLVFNLQTVIVDETDAKAKAKYEDYKQYIDLDGALALGSGWMGIDFGTYRLDEPLRHIKTNAVQSSVDAFSSADPSKVWTVRQLAEWIGIGGLGPLMVGGPAAVADELQQWVEDTDVDGFNLAYAVTHETFADIVEHLVPELQKRGAYRTEYASGTLREKLFGAGPRLPATHPAARYRDLAAVAGRGRAAAE